MTLQISKSPLEKARDDVRKKDINAIADAYLANAVGDNTFKSLGSGDLTQGRIPKPPEGGEYQGLLTEDQEYFFICASLEKGKDLNCLLNSENANCYCRKSKDAPVPTPIASVEPTSTPIGVGSTSPQPTPTSTPTPQPTLTPSSTPVGVGSSSPQPSSTATPISTPTPIPTPTPTTTAVYSDICPYQTVPQVKPATVSMEGIDGSWCLDSDYINQGTGGLVYARTPGYCIDNNHSCGDFCENNYPDDNIREGYCTGTWIGFWFNVKCDYGGYACQSFGDACNDGNNQAYCDVNAAPLPSPTPLPMSTASKRVFKTSVTYNGNLGGVAGADQKCQTRASAAGLTGIWQAWISDGTTSPDARFEHFTGPYKLLDGTKVADNWSDLIDGTLDRNINMTEFGAVDSFYSTVWTGTSPQGDSTGKNCYDWTSSVGWPILGGVGSGNSTLSYWTQGASDSSACSNAYMALYCFEQ